MVNMRIVSLIASSTEIICALGLENKLVGRSHECDYPESVLELPVCTSPKFNTDGTSYMIDERVRAILQESLSVYRVDAGLLKKLKPSHIITQSQCEVCAVSLKDLEEAACNLLEESRAEIISLEPNCLEDIYADIKRVGTACGAEQNADALVDKIRAGIKDINDRAAKLERPRVALIEWIDPLMASGNWMPELVQLAGGNDILGKAGKHSTVISWQELVDQKPDILVIAPCGFNMEKTAEDMPLLIEKKDWAKCDFVVNKKVYLADGNHFFNRPGPRVLESLQIMAEITHPDIFNFGHKNKTWRSFY